MSIQLKTAIPGPKSKALMEERRKHIARGPFHSTPVFLSKAHGALIEDVDGNTLLDFGCGIGVTNVGHTPEAVVSAVREAAGQFLHASFNTTAYESYIRLSEKLNSIAPGSFAKKTYLANSGAEAVENAIKIARVYTGRQAVVCFDHAFHGRTYMAMSLTAKAKPYRAGFAPFAPEVYRMPFPYLYRSPDGTTAASCFKTFAEQVESQIGGTNVAAVIVEPVLGEGGFIPVPQEFFQKLREYCTANKIVLIADEIQSGFGRTGAFTACEQLGVEPDLITFAKGMGAGLPISAVTGRAEIMDAPVEGGIGGTYGGNPLSCAAALAVIEIMEDPKFFAHAGKIGAVLESRLSAWREKFPFVGDARGMGAMRAIELVKDRKTKEPWKEAVGQVTRYSYEHGVVTLSAGTFGNVIRFLVPLTMTLEQLEEGLGVLEAGLREVRA